MLSLNLRSESVTGLGTSIAFQIMDFNYQIMDFNYQIINEEFENDNVWIVILKFSTSTTLKTMVKFDSNPNLKILICQTINLSRF